ncbi:phospholipase domain-containing protein [Streptomyces sp. NPDC057575]|uniref:phospholipase domain-containing protein n=1 Tax=unclassified Streptomyces TaxID=2593676 RepID=UPI0036C674D3
MLGAREIHLTVVNRGRHDLTCTLKPQAYTDTPPRTVKVKAHSSRTVAHAAAGAHGWYDLALMVAEDASFHRRGWGMWRTARSRSPAEGRAGARGKSSRFPSLCGEIHKGTEDLFGLTVCSVRGPATPSSAAAGRRGAGIRRRWFLARREALVPGQGGRGDGAERRG